MPWAPEGAQGIDPHKSAFGLLRSAFGLARTVVSLGCIEDICCVSSQDICCVSGQSYNISCNICHLSGIDDTLGLRCQMLQLMLQLLQLC